MVLAVGCVLIVNDPSVFHPYVHSSAFLSFSVSFFVGICDAMRCDAVMPFWSCSCVQSRRERQHDSGIGTDTVSQQTLPTTQKRAGTAPSLRSRRYPAQMPQTCSLKHEHSCSRRMYARHRDSHLLESPAPELASATCQNSSRLMVTYGTSNTLMQPSSFNREYYIPWSWSTGVAALNERVRDTGLGFFCTIDRPLDLRPPRAGSAGSANTWLHPGPACSVKTMSLRLYPSVDSLCHRSSPSSRSPNTFPRFLKPPSLLCRITRLSSHPPFAAMFRLLHSARPPPASGIHHPLRTDHRTRLLVPYIRTRCSIDMRLHRQSPFSAELSPTSSHRDALLKDSAST
jgi:hypothetical protein